MEVDARPVSSRTRFKMISSVADIMGRVREEYIVLMLVEVFFGKDELLDGLFFLQNR